MAGKRKRGKKSGIRIVLGVIVKVLAVVFSVSLILSYVSMFFNPQSLGVLVFLGLFFIPILFVTLLLALILLLARSRWMILPIVALLPTLLVVNRFYGFSSPETSVEPNLSIMSYNIGQQRLSQIDLPYEACTDSIVDFVNRQGGDIVCLQEVYHPLDSGDPGKLFKDYPYSHYNLVKVSGSYGFGNMIISKYPILNSGKLVFKGSTNQIIYADIDFNGQTIRVYDNHLQSTGVSFTSFVKNMYDRNKLTAEIEHMTGSLSKSFVIRSRQVDELMQHIAGTKLPVIICGDFNDTPTSYAYHMIKGNRKDTFQEAGRGFAATYCMLWPLLRIDYMFVPEKAQIVSHQTFRVKYSDHYPIMSKFKL